MSTKIDAIIQTLNLAPHPEGGFYKRIYASENSIKTTQGETRHAMTGIYFLITGNSFSAFHRLDADESWHYYEGNTPLIIHSIDKNRQYQSHTLDPNNRTYQCVIPANTWFASQCQNTTDDSYVLVGCNVAPGFDFTHFELAKRDNLTDQFPEHAVIIKTLTRT